MIAVPPEQCEGIPLGVEVEHHLQHTDVHHWDNHADSQGQGTLNGTGLGTNIISLSYHNIV